MARRKAPIGARSGPVGAGFMPKGGVAAARAHNGPFEQQFREDARNLRAKANDLEGLLAGEVTGAGASDVSHKGGARGASAARWLTTDVLARVGAASGLLALILEWVQR